MHRNGILLSCTITLIIVMMTISFYIPTYFWYLYTCSMLIGVVFAKVFSDVRDELSTPRYLISGIAIGIVGYAIILGLYLVLPDSSRDHVQHFLVYYAPQSLFEYLLLILIIAVCEELYWRGYILQMFKAYMRAKWAIVVTAFFFALPILFAGYFLCSFATFLSGIFLGLLYERFKSMPLIIVAHIVLITLLFLLLPLY